MWLSAYLAGKLPSWFICILDITTFNSVNRCRQILKRWITHVWWWSQTIKTARIFWVTLVGAQQRRHYKLTLVDKFTSVSVSFRSRSAGYIKVPPSPRHRLCATLPVSFDLWGRPLSRFQSAEARGACPWAVWRRRIRTQRQASLVASSVKGN